MGVETGRLYYLFYAIPFNPTGYSERRNYRIFPYYVEDGKEWSAEKIRETVKNLYHSKPKGYKTKKIELAKKTGIKFEVIKTVSIPL